LIFVAAFCLVLAAGCAEESKDGGGGDGGGGTGGTGPTCDNPTGPLGGEFRAYNDLLMTNMACATPDLSGIDGADIADDLNQCIIVEPPDVNGTLAFSDAGGGKIAVEGEYNLSFAITPTVSLGAGIEILVSIVTCSNTKVSGIGEGTVADGGSLTLDMLEAPLDAFNINAMATGNVTCSAVDATTGADASATVCPLANLAPGDNSVPLPGDPGARLWPVLNFTDVDGELNVQMGDGPSNANGWFISNPEPQASSGTQFVTLIGPVGEGAGGSGGSGGSGGTGGTGGTGGGG
jgi:hypothetical protein